MNFCNAFKTTILTLVALFVANVMFAQTVNVPGALPGGFSVSKTEQVLFSQGNLQFCNDSSNTALVGKWRFAGEQYEFIGAANIQSIKQDNGWMDLFAYGTSGWNHGYKYYKPTTCKSREACALGQGYYLEDDLTGNYVMADWGIYNPIMNGGNQAGYWRTLSAEEWEFLIEDRNNASTLRIYSCIDVNGTYVYGLMLLPDNSKINKSWLDSNRDAVDKNGVNVYSLLKWKNVLENNYHIVFLPEAGHLDEGSYSTSEGTFNSFQGCYWSSTSAGCFPLFVGAQSYVFRFSCKNGNIDPSTYRGVFKNFSVRLVQTGYNIKFLNYDGTVLCQDYYPAQYNPVCNVIPTKPSTCEYDYNFKGWTTVPATKDTIYVAQYDSTPNIHTVTWYDYDSVRVLKTQTRSCRQAATYPSYTVKGDNTCYHYIFNGWSVPSLPKVTRDTNIYALVDSVSRKYYITWKDYNGQMIRKDTVDCFDAVTPPPMSGKWYDADCYHYVFDKWNKNIVSPATADATYTAQYSGSIITYNIKWIDWNGNTIKDTTYNCGSTVSIPDPTRDSTCVYRYSFKEWNPAMSSTATADQTYQAEYDSTLINYTVTWYDRNSQVDQKTDYHYNDQITHPSNRPTYKDSNYVYFFDKWVSRQSGVGTTVPCFNVQFDATYTHVNRWYDVTVITRDSTTIVTVEYDSVPNLKSKEYTIVECDSTYTFNHWNPAKHSITTAGESFKAVYTDTLNIYNMTWTDSAGTEVRPQPYKAQLDTVETLDTVWKDYYIWLFDGWMPSPASLNMEVPCQDTTFTAQYHSIPRYYDVTLIYRDENISGKWDTLVNRYEFGEMPDTAALSVERWYCDSTHLFTGWNPAIEQVNDTSAKVFTAQYIDTANIYHLVWKNWNDTVLHIDSQEYQDTIIAPADPVRKTDATNVYFFTGWSPDPITQLNRVPCVDTIFRAQYKSAPRYYDVTIVLKDSTTHIRGEYDSVPNLSRFETTFVHCDSTYTFHHWNPAIQAQDTTPITYTAIYTVTVNKYYVTWNDYNNSLLRKDTLECSQLPTYTPDPTRASDCNYHYSFSHWTPAITPVTQNITYTANYSSTLRDYNITWKDWNDTVLRVDVLHCSDMPSYTPDPYKPGNPQIAYRFSNWTPSVTAVTGDAEYKAQYDSAEAYTVDVAKSYLECYGTVLKMPNGTYHIVKTDTVMVVHKHFPVIPFPETGDTLDCDSIFTIDVTVYKIPQIDMSRVTCPEAVLGMALKLDQTTNDILSFFTGAEDQVTVVNSWWEIYENRKWSKYDGHKMNHQNPIKLSFFIATEPCGDTIRIDYPSDDCSIIIQDANADNCEDCNDIDCVDALYDWLLIYKNKYMREVLGYDVPAVSVTWYKIVGDKDDLRYPNECDDKLMEVGYYLTIDQNFNGTGNYYALVDVRNCQPDTLPCRGIIRSPVFNYQGGAHLPNINIYPTETKPEGLVTITGLDPEQTTQIYVYDMTGKMILTTNVQSDVFEFVPNAPDGVYRVLLLSNNMKGTLTFIVK